ADSGDLTLAALEARVQLAEDRYRGGDFGGALEGYRGILAGRLAAGRGSGAHFRAADLVVIERLADLSALFGMFDAADDLLNGMAGLTRSAGNDLAADYAELKRAELSTAR